MNALAVGLLIAAFWEVQILIGGTRLLYSIPACLLMAAAGLLTIDPRWKMDSRIRVGCLFSTAAFCVYLLARDLFSPVDYLRRPDFLIVCGALIVYLTVSLFVVRSKYRLAMVFALLVLALIHAAIGAIQFKRADSFMLLPWLQRTDLTWRASGFYISPNHYAGMLEVIVLLTISLVCWGSFRLIYKIALSYAAAFCLLGLALSGSRGGYLSFGFGLVCFGLLSRVAARKMSQLRLSPKFLVGIGAVGLFLIVGLSVVLQSSVIRERVRGIHDPENMRFLLWKAALEQFRLQPVWGTGSGSYFYYGRMFRNPAVQNDPIYVHNDYLHLLAEYGVAGAGFFLIFFASHVVAGIKNIDLLARSRTLIDHSVSNRLALQIGAVSAIAAYTFHSVVDFNLHIPANAFLMAALFGMVANPAIGPSRDAVVDRTARTFGRVLLIALSVWMMAFGLPKLPGEWFAEKARVALRDYDLENARRYALEALRYEKHNPDIYYYAGEAMREMALQKWGPAELGNEAVSMFQAGLVQFPQDVRILLKLAEAYDELRQFDLAEEQLNKASDLDPNNGLVNAYFGMHLRMEGFLEEAELQYGIALELDGNNKMARAGYDAVEKQLNAVNDAIKKIPQVKPGKIDAGTPADIPPPQN